MKESLSVLYRDPASVCLRDWYKYSSELTSISAGKPDPGTLVSPLISFKSDNANLKPPSSPT